MNRIALSALTLAALLWAAPAAAQMRWTGRGIVTVNGGVQTSSQDVSTRAEREVYEETAVFTSAQTVESGPVFDASARMRVWRNLLVGVGYSRFSHSASAAVTASIPNPLVFDLPRTLSTTVDGVDRTEQAIHVLASWMIPLTDKFEIAVSAGPSFFTVEQGYVEDVGFTEGAPPFTDVTFGTPAVTEAKESGVGFNAGVELTYLVTSRIGVHVFGRYAGAKVDIPAVEGGSVDAGGPQFGAGLRFRF
jgi:hypothetical protein